MLHHRLSSQHEASLGFQYDRVVLIRPDVLIHNRRDLVLDKLKRGGMHCTTFGKAVGDFHFGKEEEEVDLVVCYLALLSVPFSPTAAVFDMLLNKILKK
jgi:hypothetical protein